MKKHIWKVFLVLGICSLGGVIYCFINFSSVSFGLFPLFSFLTVGLFGAASFTSPMVRRNRRAVRNIQDRFSRMDPQDCPRCGAPNQHGKFCKACGAEIVTVCSKCGQTIQSGDRFCSNCGNSINE